MSNIYYNDIRMEKQHTVSFLEYFTQVSFKPVMVYICGPLILIKYSLQDLLRAELPLASSGIVFSFFSSKKWI